MTKKNLDDELTFKDVLNEIEHKFSDEEYNFSILSTSIIAFAIHKNIKIDTRHLFNHYDKNYEYTKALYDDQVSILQPIFGTNKADSIFAKLLLPYKDMDPLELIQKTN